jgi:hypothetical protein
MELFNTKSIQQNNLIAYFDDETGLLENFSLIKVSYFVEIKFVGVHRGFGYENQLPH